jgi:hypothetical protein
MYPTLMLMNAHAHPHTLTFQTHKIESSLKINKNKPTPRKLFTPQRNSYHKVECPIIDQKLMRKHLFSGLQHWH